MLDWPWAAPAPQWRQRTHCSTGSGCPFWPTSSFSCRSASPFGPEVWSWRKDLKQATDKGCANKNQLTRGFQYYRRAIVYLFVCFKKSFGRYQLYSWLDSPLPYYEAGEKETLVKRFRREVPLSILLQTTIIRQTTVCNRTAKNTVRFIVLQLVQSAPRM